MTPEHYKFLTALVHRECGLVLDPEKTYLAESRLAPVSRKFGHEDIDALIANVMSMKSRDSVNAIIDAMVTNETYFFRDKAPFEHFTTHALPRLLEERKSSRRIRIWSAAASSGQEAYSLAMILADHATALAGWRVSILGTDISSQALAQAEAGRYSQFEVQRGLPIKQLVKHFEKAGDQWQVKSALKKAVSFRQYNLMENLSTLGEFDVVFCRNVLIYFNLDARTKILEGIASNLSSSGTLYLGGAETVNGLTESFDLERNVGARGVYRIKDAAAKGARTPLSAASTRTPLSASGARTPVGASATRAPLSASGARTPVGASAARTPLGTSGARTPLSTSGARTPLSTSGARTPVGASATRTPLGAGGAKTPLSPRTPAIASGIKKPLGASGAKPALTPRSAQTTSAAKADAPLTTAEMIAARRRRAG